jgi:hypothetical protein
MMYLPSLLLIVTIIFFSACTSSNEVSAQLANTDSVEVRFANTGNDQLSHNTGDANAVKKLVQLVSKHARSGTIDCPAQPAGIILFFERGQMKQAVMFSGIHSTTNTKCRYFITKVNDKTYHTPISDEAVAFLQGIK